MGHRITRRMREDDAHRSLAGVRAAATLSHALASEYPLWLLPDGAMRAALVAPCDGAVRVWIGRTWHECYVWHLTVLQRPRLLREARVRARRYGDSTLADLAEEF